MLNSLFSPIQEKNHFERFCYSYISGLLAADFWISILHGSHYENDMARRNPDDHEEAEHDIAEDIVASVFETFSRLNNLFAEHLEQGLGNGYWKEEVNYIHDAEN